MPLWELIGQALFQFREASENDPDPVTFRTIREAVHFDLRILEADLLCLGYGKFTGGFFCKSQGLSQGPETLPFGT